MYIAMLRILDFKNSGKRIWKNDQYRVKKTTNKVESWEKCTCFSCANTIEIIQPVFNFFFFFLLFILYFTICPAGHSVNFYNLIAK